MFQYVDEAVTAGAPAPQVCAVRAIYHLDCHFMDEVRAHLMAEHGFTLQCEGSVFCTVCAAAALQMRPKTGILHKPVKLLRRC